MIDALGYRPRKFVYVVRDFLFTFAVIVALGYLCFAQDPITVSQRNGVYVAHINYPIDNLTVVDGQGNSGSVSPQFSSQWQAQNVGEWGDSITALFANRWQTGVENNLGLIHVFQDARSGRKMCQMFENYTAASTPAINIFNASGVVPGSIVSSQNGQLIAGFPGYTASNLMDLRGSTSWVSNVVVNMYLAQTAGIAYYDVSGKYLSGVQNFSGTTDINLAAGTVMVVPFGAKYMRVWTADSTVSQPANTMMVITGGVLPGAYQAYDSTSQVSSPVDASGRTLAQNIANVNLMIVWLGTNDGSEALGAPGDAATSGTVYGCTRNAVETLARANPLMRVVFVTPYQYSPGGYGGGYATASQLAGIVSAIQYEAGQQGYPVIDLLHNSGIGVMNWPSTLRDGVHPSDSAFTSIIIPQITRGLLHAY